jgi:hypothetical protein
MQQACTNRVFPADFSPDASFAAKTLIKPGFNVELDAAMFLVSPVENRG